MLKFEIKRNEIVNRCAMEGRHGVTLVTVTMAQNAAQRAEKMELFLHSCTMCRTNV
jgi:hypothetical protein